MFQPQQDAQGCDGELHSLREDQKQLGQMLESKQIQCRELEGNADSLDGDIERQLEMKQRVRPKYIIYIYINDNLDLGLELLSFLA